MDMNDYSVKASTLVAFFNDCKLSALEYRVASLGHDSWAVCHISSDRKLQWQTDVSQKFVDARYYTLATSKVV